MTAIEIVLLIVGFIFLGISFFISRRTEESADTAVSEGMSGVVWTEQEEKMIRDRVDEILREYQMDLIDDTENQMNRICNDKIMAMDEFSQQILSKMDANHQEVVFMYNMLNEKEQEISKIVTASTGKANAEQDGQINIKEQEISIQDEQTSGTPDKRTSGNNQKNTGVHGASGKTSGKKRQTKKRSSSGGQDRVQSTSGPKDTTQEMSVHDEMNLSEEMQEKIQKMYREGKSVLEISRDLKVGQGEVKLIIALYGGRRR